MKRKVKNILRRFKDFKKVHLKGGLWGAAAGLFCVFLWFYVGLPSFLVVLGGVVGVFAVRKEIRLNNVEGLKIGIISAVPPALYVLFVLVKGASDIKAYILKHGVEEYIEKYNLTVEDVQVFEKNVLEHTYTGAFQWALMVFILILTGAWIGLIFFKPRKK